MTKIKQNFASTYCFITGFVFLINCIISIPPSSSFFDISHFSIMNAIVISSIFISLLFWIFAVQFLRKPISDWHLAVFQKFLSEYYGGLVFVLSCSILILLIYVFSVFASSRLIVAWLFFTLFFMLIKGAFSKNEVINFLVLRIQAFFLVSVFIYFSQKLLFPLEDYWLLYAAGLLLYLTVEWIILFLSKEKNLFWAIDHNDRVILGTINLFLSPGLIAFLLFSFKLGSTKFLLPSMYLICIGHTLTTCLLIYFYNFIKNQQVESKGLINKTWLFSLFYVFFIFIVNFLSLPFYTPSNPLFEGPQTIAGLWFTIPVEKDDLYPKGYARLEDSIFDDMGKPFLAGVGQKLGFVQKCKYPGPDIDFARISIEKKIQPRYGYSYTSMCEQWKNTLQEFLWRMGLAGLLGLTIILGVFVFKNPIDLVCLSIILLGGWYLQPVAKDIRAGDVSVLIAGIPFVCLFPTLIKRDRLSWLISWGLISGFVFSILVFVKSQCGLALIVSSFLLLFWYGLRDKKLFYVVITSVALLVGYNTFNMAVNGVFIYRDEKLQITAPSISPRSHGSGFALLGGLGGTYYSLPPRAKYENSMDMAFWDDIIFFNLYNDNPLIVFTQDSLENTLMTGQKLFYKYLSSHPWEFVQIAFFKSIDTLIEIIKYPINWWRMSGILFTSILFRILLTSKNKLKKKSERDYTEILGIIFVLGLVSAIPIILTDPYYDQTIFPTSAVFFFFVIILFYYILIRINFKKWF